MAGRDGQLNVTRVPGDLAWGAPSPSDGVVTLGPFARRDAAMLCDADRDPEHRRRFEIPHDFVPSVHHSERVIARWEQERVAGTRFTFAVRSVKSAELLGGCEIQPGECGTANLSFWTYRAHRRHGVAVRAVTLASELALGPFGLRCLEVLTDPDNAGARRVAARAGFREIGECGGRVVHVLESKSSQDGTS